MKIDQIDLSNLQLLLETNKAAAEELSKAKHISEVKLIIERYSGEHGLNIDMGSLLASLEGNSPDNHGTLTEESLSSVSAGLLFNNMDKPISFEDPVGDFKKSMNTFFKSLGINCKI